jgi:hypothetical protein
MSKLVMYPLLWLVVLVNNLLFDVNMYFRKYYGIEDGCWAPWVPKYIIRRVDKQMRMPPWH